MVKKEMKISLNVSMKNIKELYNGVNDSEINNINVILHNKLQNCISGECHKQHEFRDVNMKKAISFLKKLKKDHVYGIYSSSIIYGERKLHNILLFVFNLILSHGCMEDIFNRSIIILLIKDKRKSTTSIDKYRFISLCSIICKLFEYLIIDVLGNLLER